MPTPTKRFIYSDDAYDFDDMKESYCECCEMDPEDVNDEQVYTYINDIMYDDYRREIEDLDRYIGDARLVGIGSAGRWDGTYAGGFIAHDIEDAIDQLRGRDSGDIELYDTNGELWLRFIHHDGSNMVHLKRIKDAGEDYIMDNEYNYDLSERELHAELFENDDYTEELEYAYNAYGSPAEQWD